MTFTTENLPEFVRTQIDAMMAPLHRAAEALESGRNTDRMVAGGGRYATEAIAPHLDRVEEAEAKLADAVASLDEEQAAAVSAYIEANRPDLELRDGEQGWIG